MDQQEINNEIISGLSSRLGIDLNLAAQMLYHATNECGDPYCQASREVFDQIDIAIYDLYRITPDEANAVITKVNAVTIKQVSLMNRMNQPITAMDMARIREAAEESLMAELAVLANRTEGER